MTKKAEMQYCKVVRWRKVFAALGSCGIHDTAWELAGKPATLDGMAEWLDSPELLARAYRRHAISFLSEPRWGYVSLTARRWGTILSNTYWNDTVWAWAVTPHLDLIKKILELESDARGLTEMGMS